MKERFLVNLSGEFREMIDELVKQHTERTGIKTTPKLLVESIILNYYRGKKEEKDEKKSQSS